MEGAWGRVATGRVDVRPVRAGSCGSPTSALRLSERRAEHAQAIAGGMSALEAADRVHGGDTGAPSASDAAYIPRHVRRREHIARRVAAASPLGLRAKSSPPTSEPPRPRAASSQLSLREEDQACELPTPQRGIRESLRRMLGGSKQHRLHAQQGCRDEESVGSPHTGRGRQISTHI